jgi:DNA-binding GntR family transcriptional regulator
MLHGNKDNVGENVKRFQDVADDITAAIVTGELKPGQRLVEMQLCDQFNVKRNRIREALRKLEHEGFVTITPNVGAVVAGLSRVDVENTYDILSVLDGLAVRLATPFIALDQLDNLEGLLSRMEGTDKFTIYARYNDEFHSLICSYSENKRLISQSKNMRLNIKVSGYRSFSVPGQIAVSNAEHRKVVQAIKEKKSQQAEQIMRDHVIDAKIRLLTYLQKT